MPVEPQRVIGLVVLTLGAMFLLVGLGLLTMPRRQRRAREAFASTAERATGRVTEVRWELVRRRDRELSNTARVRLEYELADGRTASAWSFETSSPVAGKVGEELDVLYDPADPQRVRVAEDRPALRAVGVFFTAFAAVFSVVGALVAAGGIALLAA